MEPPKYCFIIILFFFLVVLNFKLSFANSVISARQPLSGSQTITSRGGNFALGFFQPGNNNSVQNFYIGIWYKNDPQLTSVWVANRGTPITEPANAELKISSDGNLVLSSKFRTQIWSTDATSISSNSTVAEILDSGNLVLRDGSDPGKVFWQSCDHPTNTWLPGCYLGLNKLTGENKHLTSWKNLYDPSPGLFSLSIETSHFSLIRNNSVQYWNSSIYNGQNFSFASESSSSHTVHFEYWNNATVNYFSYLPVDREIVRIVIDRHGQLQKLVWDADATQWSLVWSVPENQCDVYAVCGPFGYCIDNGSPLCSCPGGFVVSSSWDWFLGDYSSGCVRYGQQRCSSSDGFTEMPGFSVSEDPHSVSADSAGHCELACLNECSCTAYSYGKACNLWFGELLTLKFSYGYNGDILSLRVTATAKMQKDSSHRNPSLYLLLSAILSALAGLVVISLLIWRCRSRSMIQKENLLEGTVIPFRYRDLRQITNNFSERSGGGSFGSVFRGTLHDSTIVAVKRLEGFRQGEKQFRAEVSTIGLIHHVNLVRLYGFCAEGNQRLLVYKYVPNGSLDFHLFQSTSILDWKTRYQIGLGVARGLSYLHEKCRDCIIHCDIKPDNILLDASFVPKLADFGLAKLVARDFSTVLTTVRGTLGYLAPEWIAGGSVTTKADVYSYGMTLLEIISGRRNMAPYQEQPNEWAYFPAFAANKVVEGDVLSLLDPRLEGDANLEELARLCKVAFWCIQDIADCRLSMGEVVQILEGILEVRTPPIPKLLHAFVVNMESLIFSDVR